MVVIHTLEATGLPALADTFVRAFADYEQTLNLSERQLEQLLHRNGFSARASVGLFDGDRMAGFVLNAVRDGVAYDCGTALVAEYRGKGYASRMVDEAKRKLREQGIGSWVLEVLDGNRKAIGLYRKSGFTPTRTLNCYTLERPASEDGHPVTLEKGGFADLHPAPDCKPSWQNSNRSVSAGGLEVLRILADGTDAGYLCFSGETGAIAQLYVRPEFRRKGVATGAIEALFLRFGGNPIRFSNIDAGYIPMNRFLEKVGFTLFAVQQEMVLRLEEDDGRCRA